MAQDSFTQFQIVSKLLFYYFSYDLIDISLVLFYEKK